MIAACLGKIPPRGDAQLDAQVLEHNCHEIRHQDYRQQRITELCTTSQIRGPVARVHVTNCDQKTWSRERNQLPPERRRHRNDDAPMYFRQ